MGKLDAVATVAMLYGSILLLNVGLNGYFWWKTQNRYYKLLCLAWLGYVLSYIGQGAFAEGTLYQKTLALGLGFFGLLCFGIIIGELIGVRVRARRYAICFFLGLIATTLLWIFDARFTFMSAPLVLAALAPALIEGLKALFRFSGRLSPFGRLYCVATVAAAIHYGDFIFLGDLKWAPLPALSMAFVLVIAVTTLSMAAVMEVISSEAARIKTSAELELKIASSAKLASLGEMAGGVAHEVNTPLATIQISASMLLAEIDKPEINRERMKKHINLVLGTTHKIATLIKALLTFSRKDMDEGVAPTNVQGLVQSVLPFCEERFKSKGIRLETHFKESGLSLRCNEQQISQVVINLLNNAYDAVKGLPDPWVVLEAYRSDNSGVIAVTDSGSGLPVEIRQRVFDPFFTTKPLGEGTGLGLSLSKSLVEASGGKIEVIHESPHTRFEIRLPLSEGPA